MEEGTQIEAFGPSDGDGMGAIPGTRAVEAAMAPGSRDWKLRDFANELVLSVFLSRYGVRLFDGNSTWLERAQKARRAIKEFALDGEVCASGRTCRDQFELCYAGVK